MTITERLSADFAARKSYAVALSSSYGVMTEMLEERPNAYRGSPPWIYFVLPIGREEGSCQITEVFTAGERREFIPHTALGRKLSSLRRSAVTSGMPLLSEDEVLEEVKRRRGELEKNETDVY